MTYDEPGVLAEALRLGNLDVALIPSVEYLRGVGNAIVDGPALIARSNGAIFLVSQKPMAEIQRVAVHEFCRTPLVAARIVLDRVAHVNPDLLVEKNFAADWRERYDAILISGDTALDFICRPSPQDLEVTNITEMWSLVTTVPLVLGVWAYNDKKLEAPLAKTLVTSRNLGLQNLSRLADGIAATSHYESERLYNYFATNWSYQLGDEGREGLGVLEELATGYDLIRDGRIARAKIPVA
jgi:chorismate dehydratase